MRFQVKASNLKGEVAIPASKSHTIRAVFIASLAEGESEIINPLISADGLSAASACRGMGAHVEEGESWIVRGMGGEIAPREKVIDVGNSGTTARFVTGMAALASKPVSITGDEQTIKRPMGSLVEALSNLGARIRYDGAEGCLPLTIDGPLLGGKSEVSGVTSQFISSLLINAPLAKKDCEFHLPSLNERPYAEMTLDWLDSQGIRYEREGVHRFHVYGGQKYKAFKRRVPADFSSATFFLCAGAMTDSEVVLQGLDLEDSQGDKKVIDYLREMGAHLSCDEKGITVSGGDLKGIEIDMNDTPDALPALAVTACFAKGRTVLRNVPQARLKETDRISVMTEELRKMGARIEELPDGMIIYESELEGTVVQGHGDHRIVMSLAIAGLGASGETLIEGAQAVDITFPTFAELMKSLGADLRVSS